jgi:hypothetical protein
MEVVLKNWPARFFSTCCVPTYLVKPKKNIVFVQMILSIRLVLRCWWIGAIALLASNLYTFNSRNLSQALPPKRLGSEVVSQEIPVHGVGASLETSLRNGNGSDYDQYNFKIHTLSNPSCSPLEEKDVDFTLVTQLSPSRLAIMEQHCERWGNHPISLAIGTTEDIENIEKALSEFGCQKNLVTVSFVSDFNSEGEYPVNRLRNLAMSRVQTSHAFVIDADFVLSTNLYQMLRLHRAMLATDHLHTLVVPAFELQAVCNEQNENCTAKHLAMLPDTKNELVKQYWTAKDHVGPNPSVTQFREQAAFHAHASTRYEDWMTQPAEKLLPIECVTSDSYEPYLVVRPCQFLAPFQEAFVGYGQNKLTWFQQVRRMGYKFFQIGEGFVIHFPHARSVASVQFRENGKKNPFGVGVKETASAFKQWMKEHIPDSTQIPYCS